MSLIELAEREPMHPALVAAISHTRARIAAAFSGRRYPAALSALKLPHAGDDEINRLREMFEAQAWAQDWQHDTVPPGKPAHELACAAIRALPKLLAAHPLAPSPHPTSRSQPPHTR